MDQWQSIELPDGHPAKGKPGIKAYAKGQIGVVYTGIVEAKGGLIEQLSISHPERFPTINEIKEAQFMFLPNDGPSYITLPPPGAKINAVGYGLWVWQPTKRKILVPGGRNVSRR